MLLSLLQVNLGTIFDETALPIVASVVDCMLLREISHVLMVSHAWIVELPQTTLRRYVFVLFKEVLEHLVSILPEVTPHKAHVGLWLLGFGGSIVSLTDELLF